MLALSLTDTRPNSRASVSTAMVSPGEFPPILHVMLWRVRNSYQKLAEGEKDAAAKQEFLELAAACEEAADKIDEQVGNWAEAALTPAPVATFNIVPKGVRLG